MAGRVLSGLESQLAADAPNIKLEYQKELPDIAALEALIAKWEKEKAGMVILRSNAATYLGENPPAISTFIGACNNPVQLGAVKNMSSPQGNITGVTYYLPAKNQIEIFKAVYPKMDSVMLLAENDHPSSIIDQQETKAVCDEMGIEYNEALIGNKDELLAVVNENKGKVAAFIIGNQAKVIDNAKDVVAAAGDVPVFSYSSKPVKDGALGGFTADDVKLGKMLAGNVIEVLVEGKAIKDVPVMVDPEPKFSINEATASKLNLEIPFEILNMAEVI